MESRAKVLGHALHPMLIVLPLGLLLTSGFYDALYVKGRKARDGGQGAAETSFKLLGLGVLTGLVAAIPGTIDYLAIPENTRAKRVGLIHGLGNVLMLGLFGLSWLSRRKTPEAPAKGALGLSLAALALSGGTAWLGGELVERLGVGVDDEANLDARSSL